MTLLSVICCCCCRDDDSGSKQVKPHCFDLLRQPVAWHPFIRLYDFLGVLKTLRTKRIQEPSLRTQRPRNPSISEISQALGTPKNSRPKDFPSLIRISQTLGTLKTQELILKSKNPMNSFPDNACTSESEEAHPANHYPGVSSPINS